MRSSVRPARPLKLALLAIIGGAAVLVGVLAMPWIVSEGFSVGSTTIDGRMNGSDIELGVVAVGAGAAAVVLGLALLVVPAGRRIWSALLILAGGVAVAIAVTTMSEVTDTYINFALSMAGVSSDEEVAVRSSLEALFEVSDVGVASGLGVYAALGGGIVVILAGVAGMFVRRGQGDASQPVGVSEPGRERAESLEVPPQAGSVLAEPDHAPLDDVSEERSAPGEQSKLAGETPMEEPPEAQPAEAPEEDAQPAEPKRRPLGDTWSA